MYPCCTPLMSSNLPSNIACLSAFSEDVSGAPSALVFSRGIASWPPPCIAAPTAKSFGDALLEDPALPFCSILYLSLKNSYDFFCAIWDFASLSSLNLAWFSNDPPAGSETPDLKFLFCRLSLDNLTSCSAVLFSGETRISPCLSLLFLAVGVLSNSAFSPNL